MNIRANGYHDLPAFPETPPDTSVRNVPTQSTPKVSKKQTVSEKKTSFYSDSDNSSPPNESKLVNFGKRIEKISIKRRFCHFEQIPMKVTMTIRTATRKNRRVMEPVTRRVREAIRRDPTKSRKK